MPLIHKSTLGIALLTSLGVGANDSIPYPDTWKFPGVIESARKISPRNIEGQPFGPTGLAYPLKTLENLNFAGMTAAELQKYADIVTHAYPDAVSENLPASCEEIPASAINTTSISNVAYVSLNAVNKETREKSAECFLAIQKNLKKE